MNRQKRISTFLAGVSIAAIACSPAWAGGTLKQNGSEPFLFTSSLPFLERDFLDLDNWDVDGDLTVDDGGGIGGGSEENDTGIHLFNGSTIGGDLVVESYVTANQTGVDVSATAILVEDDSQIDGAIINVGLVSAEAYALGTDAFASAIAIRLLEDNDPVVMNGVDDVIRGYAFASAYETATAIAGGLYMESDESGDASALVENDGEITAEAVAIAINDGSARADAYAEAIGAAQQVSTDSRNASADLYNSGVLSAISGLALADASSVDGSAYAYASGSGVDQDVSSDAGVATASVDNEGTITGSGKALAFSVFDSAFAYASGTGINQDVSNENGTATASVINSGTVEGYGSAVATGYDYAFAWADVTGIEQEVDADNEAYATVDNTGTIRAIANASAISSSTSGRAYASADAIGVEQDVDSDNSTATASVVNTSIIIADADAWAISYESRADAEADAVGVDQEVDNDDTTDLASTTVNNSGNISGLADAWATAFEGYASANADATGIHQNADSERGDTLASVINSATVSGSAQAFASASTFASATADAIGIEQDSDAEVRAEAIVDNMGQILAVADAYAISGYSSASADASATGINQDADSDEGTALVEVTNSSLIQATAVASATAYSDASADAFAVGVYQEVDAAGASEATVDNSATIRATASAYAISTGDVYDADADAEAFGVDQEVDSDDGTGTAIVNNTGDLSVIYAAALADAFSVYGSANADADGQGVRQEVDTDDGDLLASASVTNEGWIYAGADAFASAYNSAIARADATGIEQDVDSEDGDALSSVINSGTVQALGQASAVAYTSNAWANADATGVDQETYADNFADANVDNTGLIEAIALADAFSSYSNAYADADAKGVDQYAESDYETASVLVENSSDGMIWAEARATAEAYSRATAEARADGVEQDAYADNYNANATVMNDGSIYALADAKAMGTGVTYLGATTATADAYAAGVDQRASANNDATATITNTSFFSIDADAFATAIGTDFASANAYAIGADQRAFGGGDALVETINSGAIRAFASAFASVTDVYDDGGGDAYADAYAIGLAQRVGGDDSSTAALDNSGDITAEAYAYAPSAQFGEAVAEAYGHRATGWELTLDVSNSVDGQILAFASATASDTADVIAAGAWYTGAEGSSLDGSIVNAGVISGSAYAYAAEGNSRVNAFGVVQVSNDQITTSLFNSGIISAYGEVGPGKGASAYATAIAIASYGRDQVSAIIDPLDEEPVATVTNSGGVLFAGVVQSEGPVIALAGPVNVDDVPINRGNAINTRGFETYNNNIYGAAPNAVVFNFDGGEAGSAGKEVVEALDLVSPEVQAALAANDSYGYVFGNMLLTDDDTLNFTNGVTIFDGIINPDDANVGDLNIFDGGKLVMVQNTNQTPSGGFVDELNIASDGTLVYELTTDDDVHPWLNADTANIDGTFVALYTAGLYENSMFYSNIISANVDLNVYDPDQGFAEVDDNSALLVTQAVVDDDDTIDLYVERVAFDEVGGMTENQEAAAGAIENVYGDIEADSDFGRLVANMFTLDDGDYQQFMDQLTGAEHAQHLRSVLWSTRAINRIITERMECDGETSFANSASASAGAKVGNNTVMPTADAPMAATGCFEPGTASIWMRGFGQWNNLDGDENAPGYDETQYGIIFGGDYAFDENWFLGVAGGYFNSDGDFDNWGGRPGTDYDYDGLQLAAYGGYDNSTYYLRGVISYGNYDGESNRLIAFNGSPIDPAGDPSSDTWSFYGETGYRFGITDYANITPFAGLSLATANLDGFTEDDPEGTGAALEVHDSDADSVASVLGVRFDADMVAGSGVFTPMVSVAWMHEFGDTPEVDMSFAGAPSGADFTVVASEVARDSILIDAGAKYDLNGSVNFGLFYNGQFNEDYSSNAITARLGYKF